MRKIASISAVIGINVLVGAAAVSDAAAVIHCPPPTVRVCLHSHSLALMQHGSIVHRNICDSWGCRADPSMVPVSTARPPPVIVPPAHIIVTPQSPHMNIRVK
jgi:hypothetical protein